MSEWISVKKEDLDLDEDEVNIWFEQDEFGSRYVCVKTADLEALIHQEKKA